MCTCMHMYFAVTSISSHSNTCTIFYYSGHTCTCTICTPLSSPPPSPPSFSLPPSPSLPSPLNDHWPCCCRLWYSEHYLLLCVCPQLEAVFVQRHRAVPSLPILLKDIHSHVKITRQLVGGQRWEGLVGRLKRNSNSTFSIHTEPYSGKLSREKTSRISWFFSHLRKFSPQNFRHATPIMRPVLTFRKSFLHKMLPSDRSAKVSRYTV